MSALSVGACFAGYGGLELGLESVLPARTAWVSEIGAAPARILAHRFPAAPNLGDITRVRWADVEPVDVVTGGFPCQDVSHAGKRAGLGPGTRTGLWARMLEAVDTLRPRLVLAENVRGLLSAPAASDVESCPWCMGGAGDAEPPMRALGAVLADLADVGYDAAWSGLRASDVGAPHGRFRVFVLAWPRSRPPTYADGAGLQGPERVEGPPAGWPTGHNRSPVALLPTPTVNDMGRAYTPEEWDEWRDRMRAAHGNGNGHGPSLHVEAVRMLPTPTATDARSSGGGYGGQSNVTLTDATVRQSSRFGVYAEAVERWEAVLGRPAPAPTEPLGRDGTAKLSPAFVEWMMGLPAGWVTGTPGVSTNEALAALGNGVMPQQASAALRRLLAIRNRYAA